MWLPAPMPEDRDLLAALRAAGHDIPPERMAEALALLRAMAEVARRLERLGLAEPPA
jgi:hypothetical protein